MIHFKKLLIKHTKNNNMIYLQRLKKIKNTYRNIFFLNR